jgi:hypothetical protein
VRRISSWLANSNAQKRIKLSLTLSEFSFPFWTADYPKLCEGEEAILGVLQLWLVKLVSTKLTGHKNWRSLHSALSHLLGTTEAYSCFSSSTHFP